MAPSSSQVAARLRQRYPGLEGFYIVNHAGRLGYLSGDGARLCPETLDGVAPDQAARFNQELAQTFAATPVSADHELGYMLPADDTHVWHTATLVLHDHVAQALRDAFHRDISKGRLSLAEGERRAPDNSPERGLHRGFEDLLKHISAFGIQAWFPVLHIRAAGATAQPLRVLNLVSLLRGTGRFNDVLATMRDNLAARGALNQAPRVEHRFTLQDED